jgi:hypothetical protein
MNKEQKVILREIVWELNRYYPKVLTALLERMDLETLELDKIMTQLDKETEGVKSGHRSIHP